MMLELIFIAFRVDDCVEQHCWEEMHWIVMKFSVVLHVGNEGTQRLVFYFLNKDSTHE